MVMDSAFKIGEAWVPEHFSANETGFLTGLEHARRDNFLYAVRLYRPVFPFVRVALNQ